MVYLGMLHYSSKFTQKNSVYPLPVYEIIVNAIFFSFESISVILFKSKFVFLFVIYIVLGPYFSKASP